MPYSSPLMNVMNPDAAPDPADAQRVYQVHGMNATFTGSDGTNYRVPADPNAKADFFLEMGKRGGLNPGNYSSYIQDRATHLNNVLGNPAEDAAVQRQSDANAMMTQRGYVQDAMGTWKPGQELANARTNMPNGGSYSVPLSPPLRSILAGIRVAPQQAQAAPVPGSVNAMLSVPDQAPPAGGAPGPRLSDILTAATPDQRAALYRAGGAYGFNALLKYGYAVPNSAVPQGQSQLMQILSTPGALTPAGRALIGPLLTAGVQNDGKANVTAIQGVNAATVAGINGATAQAKLASADRTSTDKAAAASANSDQRATAAAQDRQLKALHIQYQNAVAMMNQDPEVVSAKKEFDQLPPMNSHKTPWRSSEQQGQYDKAMAKLKDATGHHQAILDAINQRITSLTNVTPALASGSATPAATSQPTAPSTPTGLASGEPVISSNAEYAALPSGTFFVGPDRVRRRKL